MSERKAHARTTSAEKLGDCGELGSGTVSYQPTTTLSASAPGSGTGRAAGSRRQSSPARGTWSPSWAAPALPVALPSGTWGAGPSRVPDAGPRPSLPDQPLDPPPPHRMPKQLPAVPPEMDRSRELCWEGQPPAAGGSCAEQQQRVPRTVRHRARRQYARSGWNCRTDSRTPGPTRLQWSLRQRPWRRLQQR